MTTRHRFLLPLLLSCAVVSFFPRVSTGQENPCSFSGYLWGTGARTSFEVYSDTEELSMVISWPAGTADFWVKATDNDGKEVLVDRSLNEGDLLTLTGRGIFHFEIYSKWGVGCWKATVKKNR